MAKKAAKVFALAEESKWRSYAWQVYNERIPDKNEQAFLDARGTIGVGA
jgi:hypothetical protein